MALNNVASGFNLPTLGPAVGFDQRVWTYDASNRPVTCTFKTSASGTATTVCVITYTYDASGNCLTETRTAS